MEVKFSLHIPITLSEKWKFNICVCVCANDEFLGFMLSEIHFNFSGPIFSRWFCCYSAAYVLNLRPSYTLFCCFVLFSVCQWVFSHILKRLTRKESAKDEQHRFWIAMASHVVTRSQVFHFVVSVSGRHNDILPQQWFFGGSSFRHDGLWSVPNTYFVSSYLYQFFRWEILVLIKIYNAKRAIWV